MTEFNAKHQLINALNAYRTHNWITAEEHIRAMKELQEANDRQKRELVKAYDTFIASLNNRIDRLKANQQDEPEPEQFIKCGF